MEIKYLMALFSNIALTNAIQYVRANQENEKNINEYNFSKYFLLNDSWKNLLNRIRRKKQKLNDNKIKDEDVAELISKYLKSIRNFYSHSENHEKYQENKVNMESFESDEYHFSYTLELLLKSMYNNSDFLWSLPKEEKRILIISFFLNSSEINDLLSYLKTFFKNNLNKNIFDIFEITKIYRKYRFKPKFVNKIDTNIHQKVINYIKNFNESKNYKSSFIKMGISLLNFKYKNKFHFKKCKNNENFFVEYIKITNSKFSLKENPEKYKKINHDGLRYLLLCEHNSFFKILNKIQIKKFDIKENNNFDSNDYESFVDRFKNIDDSLNRHLLKTFNRVIYSIYKNDNEEYNKKVFKYNQFELLHQVLLFKKIKYLDNDKDVKQKIEEILEIDNIEKYDTYNLRNKIKEFIFKKIDSKEKFQDLYTRIRIFIDNQENFLENKSSNKLYAHIKLIHKLVDNKNNPYDHKLFNFQNISKHQKKFINNIKKYMAPIIIFYIKSFKKDEKHKEIDDDFLKQFNNINLFDNNNKNEKIKYIFNQRIPKNKDTIVIKIFKNKNLDKEYQLNDFNLNDLNLNDLYLVVNSKLFFGFKELLYKNTNDIGKHEWKEIVKKINEYKKIELELVKKYFNDDVVNKQENNTNDKKTRDFILHRSINKFQNIDEYKKIIDLDKKISLSNIH